MQIVTPRGPDECGVPGAVSYGPIGPGATAPLAQSCSGQRRGGSPCLSALCAQPATEDVSMRRLLVRIGAAAALLAVVSTSRASAQIPTASFEITPLAGYLWGGGFQTPQNGIYPAGKISIQPSFAWGGELGYTPNGNTWFELTYLHQ